MLADWQISEEDKSYAEYDDGFIDDSLLLKAKGGFNIELDRHWHFTIEAQYFLVDEQFSWNGVEESYDLDARDTDNDSEVDEIVILDYRRLDPGNLRLDGVAIEVGLRWVGKTWNRGGDKNKSGE